MSEAKLGEFTSEGDFQRDAVHVATIPCVAGENLKPGDRIQRQSDGCAKKNSSGHGLADPFLIIKTSEIKKGQSFLMCLLPGTVTGMRHQWQHPDFQEDKKFLCSKDESEAWLREYVKTADCPGFDIVIAAAVGEEVDWSSEYYESAYEIDDEYFYFGGRDAHGSIPPEFWDHIENYTGKSCPHRAKYWSCSC